MTAWTARMIAADKEFDGAPLLSRSVELESEHGAVLAARLVVTARGVCAVSIDGIPVSDDLLTPGWTSYEWRLRYAEYQVAAMLVAASSATITIALGNGWYRGRLGPDGGRHFYGEELAAILQLEIRYADGHLQTVGTDDSWVSRPSETTANDLYDGQSIDARRRGEDPEPAGTHLVDVDLGMLEPASSPPVRRIQEVAPVAIHAQPSGTVLIDFGQNLVGWARIRVRGDAGGMITVRYAEVLENGELGTRPLRTAQATDRFTLSGGDDLFEPTLTFHGFRYAEIDGWPGAITEGALTAVVIGSDLRRIGEFGCSDDLLNRLHENVVWSMRGNFLGVPTDCPQRDERLGWTGDIAAFAPTAASLFDVGTFLRDWLRDLALEQDHQDGVIPAVVPDLLKYLRPADAHAEATAIWSDAGVWVPWAIYRAYGDEAVLRDQFDSMLAHGRRVRSLLSENGLWDTGFQFGDWLDPTAPPENAAAAKADPSVVATICAYRSAALIADAGWILHRTADAAEFEAMATELREAFTEHYLVEGRIESDAPTVYALAIVFGILDEADRHSAGDRLALLVAENGYRVSTGFAGTPFITEALSSTGHLDAAYRLLTEQQNPSWLYPVLMGATTVWERWDSMLPDGSINPGEMTSFNHYAFGSIADWMHRTVAGLAPAEPGYATILFAPQPGGGLTSAWARLQTPRGVAAIEWNLADDHLVVDMDVPFGATAVLRLPGRADDRLGPGHHRAVAPAPRV